MRQYRYFESDDIEDTRERIAAVLQPHRLVPGTARTGHSHSAYMNYLRVEGLGIGSIAYAGAMGVDAGALEDYYLLVLSLNGYADVTVGGRRAIIGQSQGVLVCPSTRFGGSFSGDCEQLIVRIDKQAIQAHTGYDQLQVESVIDLTRPALAPWLAQLRMLASSPESVSLAQRDRLVATEFERLFIMLLLAGQPHLGQARPASLAPAPRTVRRAEAYIVEHACEPITLADIAEAAGVPVRTLLDGFHRYANTSPMQLVRESRLARARDLLLRARDAERVADIALSCGFANLGRFANAYRERFGETPSDTLRQVRRRTS